jgi:Mlc titration factor MtfA (ptsG expression regulator)
MPGDSLLVQDNTGSDTMAVSRAMLNGVRAMHGHHHNRLWLSIDTIMMVVGCILFIFASGPLYKRLRGRYRHRRLQQDALESLDAYYARYDEWLSANNSYYKSLSIPLRRRFVLRVMEFMKFKKFEYVDLSPDEKMPLLISAAAIQLTFGLDEYLFDFFDTIYVLQHDYRYGMYNTPFAGHVSHDGIYLSWDNFLRGFANDADGDNVGIHEMAHALAYVNFTADDNGGEDDVFKARFEQFAQTAHPIFDDMQQGGQNMLDRYAATNYNEFWAVSVETFFEKSLLMKQEMPRLYNALCELLGQDPLLTGKLLEAREMA